MHATVHLADLGFRTLRDWRRAMPRPGATAGLRYAVAPIPAPLGTRGPRPQFGRLGLIAFWDGAGSADRFLSGSIFERGWYAHLEPVRAVGAWPGLPEDLPVAPDPVHEGPSVVITIGRLRLLQAHRFFPASARAEQHVVASPGLTWGTGLANIERRTLATLSWWHDFAAMDGMARADGPHLHAMRKQSEKDFHHESAFIRFRPLAVAGSLEGRNPLPDLAGELG